MIPRWKIIQNVANRYGGLEDVFDEAERKLKMVRDGQIPL